MKKKKENRGGARPGSGQPKKAPTKTVSFRVRLEFVDPVKKLVKAAIEEWSHNSR
jgi:hypothetical protein